MTTKPVDRIGFIGRWGLQQEGRICCTRGLLDWSSLISDAIQVIHTGSVANGAQADFAGQGSPAL